MKRTMKYKELAELWVRKYEKSPLTFEAHMALMIEDIVKCTLENAINEITDAGRTNHTYYADLLIELGVKWNEENKNDHQTQPALSDKAVEHLVYLIVCVRA